MYVPGTDPIAFNCTADNDVPSTIDAGFAHVSFAFARTSISTVVSIVENFGSVGTKTTFRVCLPTGSTVGAAGAYVYVPGRLANAFN